MKQAFDLEALARKFIQGDPDAMVFLSTAVGVVLDLNYLRANGTDTADYLNTRQDLDEEIDNLTPQIEALELKSVLAQK